MIGSQEVNSLGLLLDIAGVIVLFKFGLPSRVREGGVGFLKLEGADAEEAQLFRRYQFFARCGLSSLMLGFLLQLISNFMPGAIS